MSLHIPSIGDIGITLIYNDHNKRSDFRMQHGARISCEIYKLENTADRKHIRIVKPLVGSKRSDSEQDDSAAIENFEQDIDYVSCLCENQAIGFSLDDIMTALYGQVLKPNPNTNGGGVGGFSKRRGSKKNTEDDAKNGKRSTKRSVCYSKRLAQTANYTGLAVKRLVPIVYSNYSKSDRRRIKDNNRILPVHFLPQFLITQSVSVQKTNNVLMLCFDLLLDMERLSRAFSNNRLYIYTVQQLRVNFTQVINDINFRAISATEFMHEMGRWERQRLQMRELFDRMGPAIGRVVDTLTETDEDAITVFLKQIAPKLATTIQEATEQINTAMMTLNAFASESSLPSRKRELDDVDADTIPPLKRRRFNDGKPRPNLVSSSVTDEVEENLMELDPLVDEVDEKANVGASLEEHSTPSDFPIGGGCGGGAGEYNDDDFEELEELL